MTPPKAPRRPRVARAKPWLTQVEADRRILKRVDAKGRPGRALAAAAPRLADSQYAEALDHVLARATDKPEGLEIALAIGRRALVNDRLDEALRWLVQARSLATEKTPVVAARIAFLLGAIYIGRDEEVAADAVLAWAEGILGREADSSADVLHLRALLAERRGDRDVAMALYREVLQRANVALTPMTRVLAMRNLAAMLAHARPRESVGLYAMALATLDADELDASTRCGIDNGMGYALLCSGDVDGARMKLDQASSEAKRVGAERVEVFANFNRSLVDELSGDLHAADARLRAVEADARRHDLDELAGWTRIRRAWLQLRAGSADAAAAALREAFATAPRTEHREAIATLSALIRLPDRLAASRAQLSALAAAYRKRDDALTDFTLTLWVAHADAASGRLAAARRNVARACGLGSERGFRLGTSWWSSEVVTVAREHAPAEFADFADRLLVAPSTPRPGPERHVVVSRDGTVTVDGQPLDESTWRQGRSGSGVLRRYFRALLSAYPAALARDELADLLWPESEGDKAVRNLYDATKDLRRVLVAMPGVQLRVTEQTYGLVLASSARVH